MKSDKALDSEIKACADFVNSFPAYDPQNIAQMKGFLVLHALEWARGTATGGQRLWHAAERKRGAMVIVAGIDFDADTESFLAWYRASGLMRRPL